MIKEIERLSGQIDFKSLPHREMLDEREVDVVDRTAGLRISTGIGKRAKPRLDVAGIGFLANERSKNPPLASPSKWDSVLLVFSIP